MSPGTRKRGTHCQLEGSTKQPGLAVSFDSLSFYASSAVCEIILPLEVRKFRLTGFEHHTQGVSVNA